jgi:hypothetical protein
MHTTASFAVKVTFLNALLPVLLLAFPACSLGVAGNGERTQENRDLGDFSSVIADGDLEVQVHQSDTTSVVVDIDSNLQPVVRTSVANGQLVIDTSESIWHTVAGPHVIVTMPLLHAARLEGSGSLSAETFHQDDGIELGLEGSGDMDFGAEVPTLTARVEGSGNLRVHGVATSVELELDGSGDLRATDLSAATAAIRLGGSGSLAATVTGSSRVTLSGSGDIDLFGGGVVESSSLSGSGQLRTY